MTAATTARSSLSPSTTSRAARSCSTRTSSARSSRASCSRYCCSPPQPSSCYISLRALSLAVSAAADGAVPPARAITTAPINAATENKQKQKDRALFPGSVLCFLALFVEVCYNADKDTSVSPRRCYRRRTVSHSLARGDDAYEKETLSHSGMRSIRARHAYYIRKVTALP